MGYWTDLTVGLGYLTLAVVLAIMFIGILPVLFFWSFHTLFGFYIEYNIWTVIAFWIFMTCNPLSVPRIRYGKSK